jgi:hypothetical protein
MQIRSILQIVRTSSAPKYAGSKSTVKLGVVTLIKHLSKWEAKARRKERSQTWSGFEIEKKMFIAENPAYWSRNSR